MLSIDGEASALVAAASLAGSGLPSAPVYLIYAAANTCVLHACAWVAPLAPV